MSVLNIADPPILQEEELSLFGQSALKFFHERAPEERQQRWRDAGMVDRGFWTEAGQAGLLGVSVPAEYGGAGGDFRHDVTLFRSQVQAGVDGFNAALHNGIVVPYVVAHGTEAQKKRWLPRLCSGELIAAIAMSEPSVGSDLQNIRTTARCEGDGYRISGAKTFISSGQLANFIVVAAKTDPSQGAKGVSLLVVESDRARGFRRGRKLKKMGQDAADTSGSPEGRFRAITTFSLFRAGNLRIPVLSQCSRVCIVPLRACDSRFRDGGGIVGAVSGLSEYVLPLGACDRGVPIGACRPLPQQRARRFRRWNLLRRHFACSVHAFRMACKCAAKLVFLPVGPISPTSVCVIRRIAPLSDTSERGRAMDALLFASGRSFHMSMDTANSEKASVGWRRAGRPAWTRIGLAARLITSKTFLIVARRRDDAFS